MARSFDRRRNDGGLSKIIGKEWPSLEISVLLHQYISPEDWATLYY